MGLNRGLRDKALCHILDFEAVTCLGVSRSDVCALVIDEFSAGVFSQENCTEFGVLGFKVLFEGV